MTALLARPEIPDHPFVADAPARFVDELTQFDATISFVPGQIIFSEGTYADRFYLVMAGEIALETKPGEGRPPVCIQHLGAGKFWAGRGFIRPMCGISARGQFRQSERSSLMLRH